ncbi:MAG: hypothetical protein LKJ18_09750 [Ancrocorticia sp.]|nr:hypothetical protein [Ancrocorticia sp.]
MRRRSDEALAVPIFFAEQDIMKVSPHSFAVPAVALILAGTLVSGCSNSGSATSSTSSSASPSASASATVARTAAPVKTDQPLTKQGAADYAASFFLHWFDPVDGDTIYAALGTGLEDVLGDDAYTQLTDATEPVAAFEALTEEQQAKALDVLSQYNTLSDYLDVSDLTTAEQDALDFYLVSYTASMGSVDSTLSAEGDGSNVTLSKKTATVPFSAITFTMDGEQVGLMDDDDAYSFTLVAHNGKWKVSGKGLLDFFTELSASAETESPSASASASATD